jgi:hypothetical protein
MILRKNPKKYTVYFVELDKEYKFIDFIVDVLMSFKNEKGTIYVYTFHPIESQSIEYENGTIVEKKSIDDYLMNCEVSRVKCILSESDGTINYYVKLSLKRQ